MLAMGNSQHKLHYNRMQMRKKRSKAARARWDQDNAGRTAGVCFEQQNRPLSFCYATDHWLLELFGEITCISSGFLVRSFDYH